MAAGTQPIFAAAPRSSIGPAMLTANTAMDGTGTVNTIFTAGANGSFVARVNIRALGTNVASVVRIFLNNGSTNTVATNNALVGEVTLPATTASNSAQQADYVIPLNFGVEANYKLLATIGTAVAAGWICSTFGGDY